MDNSNVALIIRTIDDYLEKNGQPIITAVAAAEILEKKGILNDSSSRPGKPLRDLLRAGKLPHAYQDGVYWKIPHSDSFSKKKTLIPIKFTFEQSKKNCSNNSSISLRRSEIL